MKVLNDKGTDLSNEVYIHMMLLMFDVWSDEMLCSAISRSLRSEFQKNTYFQQKYPAMRRVKTLVDQINEILQKEFDPKFFELFGKRPGQEVEVTDGFMQHANDLMIMKLVYITRSVDNDDKKASMIKALMNFKACPDYDLNSILKYWKVNI